ncbi:hypothetical protein SGFS_030520 [Streptomyces graminofaciens]|uniref:DUF4232 domain-containing protein n=1 Tax=Streptomyces graminofaciens TaxID=68212 RepID=A0ABN5VFK6_9ACTN|nr:hypothetical protein SGFS_030520 [Streptomyces graminofaciens]
MLLTAAALTLLVSGCGLSAELDRERDPGRAEPSPSASPAGTEAAGTWPSEMPDLSVSELDVQPTEVPTPDPSSPCPGSGVRIRPELVATAMGLRAMGVTLTNCGKKTYTLNGYPELEVLDAESEPAAVRVLKGSGPITTAVPDLGPHAVTLKPGESARTELVWRNTVTEADTPAVNAPYLRVTPAKGRPAEIVAPDGGIDLGNTGRLGRTAWAKVAEGS